MIFADAMYDGNYDGPPRLSYMICGARRSGTTWLGKMLWEAGLGKPFEYQLPECRGLILERMPRGIAYWDFLRKTRTTPNGVFAFKEVAPAQYRLRNLIPEKVILVDRRDMVAQAVSLFLANWTGAFFHFQEGAKERPEPEYDYNGLMNALLGILEIKSLWEQTLAADGFTPLRLFYEDLSHDLLPQIAEFLGVESEWRPDEVPAMRKQGTSRNEEWAARFRAEAIANGCSFGDAQPAPARADDADGGEAEGAAAPAAQASAALVRGSFTASADTGLPPTH